MLARTTDSPGFVWPPRRRGSSRRWNQPRRRPAPAAGADIPCPLERRRRHVPGDVGDRTDRRVVPVHGYRRPTRRPMPPLDDRRHRRPMRTRRASSGTSACADAATHDDPTPDVRYATEHGCKLGARTSFARLNPSTSTASSSAEAETLGVRPKRHSPIDDVIDHMIENVVASGTPDIGRLRGATPPDMRWDGKRSRRAAALRGVREAVNVSAIGGYFAAWLSFR